MNLQDALQKKMDRRKKKDAKDKVTLDKGQGDLSRVTPITYSLLDLLLRSCRLYIPLTHRD